MSVKMIVTVKQVPDTHNISGDAMKADGTVNRGALPTIFNPEDLNALEEALKVKDKIGGHITAISMGPPKAIEVLKESLYRGADDVALITDRRFAGADTLATSYVLKSAIEKIGKFDIVFCGRQAIDGDTAQVGPQIAEKLKINQLTCVFEVVAVDDKSITVKRFIDGGYEIVKSHFPVLITVTAEANEPRPPSVKKVMTYKNLTQKVNDQAYDEAYLGSAESSVRYIKELNVENLGIDPNRTGLGGSPTKVKTVESVVLTAREVKQIANTEDAIAGLMRELISEHIIG